MPTAASRAFAVLIALIAAAALVLQYILLLRLAADEIGVGLVTLRFFSYFTVLSNLLVALAAVSVVVGGDAWLVRFFTKPRVLAGIALYIGITGAIYVAILRHLWQPQGAQWWADAGLHYVTPSLYLGWWLSGLRHGELGGRDVPLWLVFPGAFLLWSFMRGAWVHEYPYPFIDVDALGLPLVLRNAAGIMLLLIAVGALLVVIDGALARRGTHAGD